MLGFRLHKMGICLSNQIKAESPFHTATGNFSNCIKWLLIGATSSKTISADVTELSSSSSKRSSASIPPTPRSEGEILQSSNMKSFAFSDLKDAPTACWGREVLVLFTKV
ncbi:probable serine/threonine-protein kinase PBL9 isoform X1 [Salvia splendens]|uniref:probable serine/threonine-protein kinase PBL9 isoform X1 n=1 Tax=Salvia splendens TaxID=180675 RepID=UPI001C26B5F7|nr:probable serine/threonine-protein kinase PBL9 isoform X1 [Salvia splendens]